MSIKEMILKQKGIWLFRYKDNYKMVIDFDNKAFDSYEWYKVYGTLETELVDEMIDQIFKGAIECKKIK